MSSDVNQNEHAIEKKHATKQTLNSIIFKKYIINNKKSQKLIFIKSKHKKFLDQKELDYEI